MVLCFLVAFFLNQALWPHKSVVLMWENEATEWYYEKMKPGETHVPVNAENFIESLDRLKANDNEVRFFGKALDKG